MILVTGAGGKTGRAVISALVALRQPVRALVHREGNVPVVECAESESSTRNCQNPAVNRKNRNSK